ncbi:MAG: hypothetical protein H7Z73_03230 [Candidatus Saccharibacteria bacterium]|nr:hypothetical protein [Moraxellaceae bacterium]
MKKLLWIALGSLFLIVIGLILWLKPKQSIPVVPSSPMKAAQQIPTLPQVTADLPVIQPNLGVGQKDSPLLPMLDPATFPPVDAATTMAETREHGDPRTPPIEVTPAREKPTPAELDDPKQYAQYEARQNAKLYKAYVASADKEVPALQADIERAKKEGFSQEQIKVVEEKVRRIQEMRDQLKAQHPELYQ